MNEEKKMILDMLKEGKITVEQASDLLEAVGKDKNKNNDDNFINKLSQSFESIMKKTSEKLSNIDIDFDINDLNIPSNLFNINATAKESQIKIDDDINEISLDITNGSFEIERSQESSIIVDQKVFFKNKEDVEKDYLSIDVVDDRLEIKLNETYKTLNARPEIKLYLGKNIYDKLYINLVNGDVEICDVDFRENIISTTNVKTTIINSSGNVEIDNTNGKIELRNTNGNLNINNVNGPIYLTNVSGDVANIEVINGAIRSDGFNIDTLNASTNVGSVKFSKLGDSKDIKIRTQFGSVTIDTENVDKEIKAFLNAPSYHISEKFKNKLQKNGGYEVSTNPEIADLDIEVTTRFGSASIQ
ncbi:DUF4097 family beta strand repeat protein [Anaerococcus sp. AGMB00486]|uniref:DUF4097 family beta strand repeat protein n=2 Tax=Anaerococcus TaxID=165779 RepID=A0ABX2NCD2_9FIRM|nr:MULTISPECIES: DUF4097 family beta strand repeat-containing protein [Anaerococcus]MDY3007061.1 DUF4097 family beta strand repeat-containing protein [Anaerococcus porci]MSS78694.1 DUF4097 family beta strand repeat protein [Anaerococcus porci]NVF12194.1 DUF4097 family beta strand repeat protein [Anaerococcus faecalis]